MDGLCPLTLLYCKPRSTVHFLHKIWKHQKSLEILESGTKFWRSCPIFTVFQFLTEFSSRIQEFFYIFILFCCSIRLEKQGMRANNFRTTWNCAWYWKTRNFCILWQWGLARRILWIYGFWRNKFQFLYRRKLLVFDSF